MALEDAANQVDTAVTRSSMKGLSYEATFGGITSFLRRRYTKDLTGVDLAITGIPFDNAVTNRPGARLGPRALREASSLQAPDAPYGWSVDPMSEFNLIDYGDLAYDYAKTSAFPAALEGHIDRILESGASCLALGGDHFVTYPILKSVRKKFGAFYLLQFDAHTDTWADDDPDRIDHGTMLYKAVKDGTIDPSQVLQVGIRTSNPNTLGTRIIDAPKLHGQALEATISEIKSILGDAQVYISFDIDCLDPGFAPGTGTPVSGGLSTAQAIAILRGLKGVNLIGMDVVEVSPPFDTTGATAIAGAHIATELLCLWAHFKKFSGASAAP